MRRAHGRFTTGLITLGVLAGGLASGAGPVLAAGVPEEPLSGPSVGTLTSSSAVLEGELNPGSENGEVGWHFTYGTEGACTGTGVIPEAPSVAEGNHVHVTMEVVGLQPDKQYSYCLVASDPSGATSGAPVTFTTLPLAPSVDTESVSSSGADEHMVLEAKINPNNQQTTYFFEYAGEEALLGTPGATKIAGEDPVPAQFAEVPVSVETSIAHPDKTYYYRVVAENETSEEEHQPVNGPVQSFALPTVSTGEAENITRSTATFSGTVNTQGAEATYYFAYIGEAGYQAALAEHASNPYADGETTTPTTLGASTEPQAVGPALTSTMLPETTYHYALIAHSILGVTIGQDKTVTTLSRRPPILSTGSVTDIDQDSAIVSGTVSTNSLQTEYGFEIGTEPENYGAPTGLGSLGGQTTETVTLSLKALQPGTTYYYRITATNADGTRYGTNQSFTTSPLPDLFTITPSLPVIPTPTIAFPTTNQANTSTIQTKTLTNTQKLARTLKACKKDKNKHRRATCEKQAHKKYATSPKKKK